jgi:electron transfer flavoprotein beta subunit
LTTGGLETLMRCIVLIKQVPETSNVKMDEERGTVIREGKASIMNPMDLYAVEAAIRLKENLGGEITVLTMGPASAEKALREAIAMGCDEGILISGQEFSGSDTWATSYVLSEAIKKIGEFDIIFTGERATDGETGQVGPEVASFLGVPLAAYTSRIVEVDPACVIVERLTEEGYEMLKLGLPALLTVVKEISYPRLPTLRGKQRARMQSIPVWSKDTMDLDVSCLGLKGSPTRVVKITSPKITRQGTVVKASDEEEISSAVHMMVQLLRKKNLLTI